MNNDIINADKNYANEGEWINSVSHSTDSILVYSSKNSSRLVRAKGRFSFYAVLSGIVFRKAIRIDCSNDIRLSFRSREENRDIGNLEEVKIFQGRGKLSTPYNTSSYRLRDSIYSRDWAYDYHSKRETIVGCTIERYMYLDLWLNSIKFWWKFENTR